MARRNSRSVMGGVFLMMGLLMALTALLDAVGGFEDVLSATFFFPALLSAFFFVVGAYLLLRTRRRSGS